MTIGTESDVRALLEVQAEAMRTKDLDRLMPLYHPDIVYFDVVPPLQFVGSAALRGRFTRWFSGFQGPIGMEIRDLDITSGGDIAVARWFSRASGILQDGREVGFWVRVTNCCRRTDQGWLITHEHVSLPVDLATRSPAMELVPD